MKVIFLHVFKTLELRNNIIENGKNLSRPFSLTYDYKDIIVVKKRVKIGHCNCFHVYFWYCLGIEDNFYDCIIKILVSAFG